MVPKQAAKLRTVDAAFGGSRQLHLYACCDGGAVLTTSEETVDKHHYQLLEWRWHIKRYMAIPAIVTAEIQQYGPTGQHGRHCLFMVADFGRKRRT